MKLSLSGVNKFGLIAMTLIPVYEFGLGLYYRYIKKKDVWRYLNYPVNSYRSISPFSLKYFIAWYILGVLFYLVQMIF